MQSSTFTDDKSYTSHNFVGPRAPNNPTIKNKLFVKRKSRKDTKKIEIHWASMETAPIRNDTKLGRPKLTQFIQSESGHSTSFYVLL